LAEAQHRKLTLLRALLAAALLAINTFHAQAQAIFAIIAVANVASCLVLIVLFRRVLGARVAA